MRLAPGTMARLSTSMIKFFEDFKTDKEVLRAKSYTFLVLESKGLYVTALCSDGTVHRFTSHDLQSI